MSLEKPLLDEERGGAEKIKKLTPEQLDVFIHSKGIYNGLQVFAVLRRYGDKAEFQKHFEDWIENFSAEFHIAAVVAFSSNPKLLNDFGRNTPIVADRVKKLFGAFAVFRAGSFDRVLKVFRSKTSGSRESFS